jgi:hypothetical protein
VSHDDKFVVLNLQFVRQDSPLRHLVTTLVYKLFVMIKTLQAFRHDPSVQTLPFDPTLHTFRHLSNLHIFRLTFKTLGHHPSLQTVRHDSEIVESLRNICSVES